MRATLTCALAVGAAAALAGEARAATIFLESSGVVSAEAENFSARNSGTDLRSWSIVPTETARVGTFTGTMTGGAALQVLADSGAATPGTVPDTTPYVDFVVRIATTGTYRLHLKAAGFSGTSDSVYAQIVELGDNATGGLPDYYASAFGTGNLDAWVSSGAMDNGTASTANPMTWAIGTPGDYTVRINLREDGALVDKVVLQLNSLTTPTGAGPAESATVPEPATAGVLGVAALGLLARRRRA